MPQDIPNNDAGLIADVQNFVSVVTGAPAHFGLTAAQVSALSAALTAFQGVIATVNTTRTTLLNLNAQKRADDDALVALYRELRQVAQKNPTTNDADRAALHLATGAGDPSVHLNNSEEFQTAPLLDVQQSGVHVHRINFFMKGKASGSTRKPSHAVGCKLFVKIDGAPSTDLNDYEMIAIDSRSPYEYIHKPENAGKLAHFIGAWADADGGIGNQSETFSAMIT